MFNIADFNAEINSRGVVKPSNYDVTLTRRSNQNTEIERSLKFRCSSIAMPARTIQTADKQYYGPSYRVGYGSQFAELQMQILLSEDMREKEYFEAWQDLVVGDYRLGKPNTKMFDIGYYDDYVGDLDIAVYNDVKKKTYSVRAHDAWPAVVAEPQLSFANGNEVMLLSVSMSYKYLIKQTV